MVFVRTRFYSAFLRFHLIRASILVYDGLNHLKVKHALIKLDKLCLGIDEDNLHVEMKLLASELKGLRNVKPKFELPRERVLKINQVLNLERGLDCDHHIEQQGHEAAKMCFDLVLSPQVEHDVAPKNVDSLQRTR